MFRLLCCLCLLCPMSFAEGRSVKIIFDTDIASDVDDVGAVALLHALANKGEAEILGMAVSSSCPHGVACLDVLNTYFGRPDIPIGRVRILGERKKMLGRPSKYAGKLAEKFPHVLRDQEAKDAVQLYRGILAQQKDRDVVIVTVGFLTNLADLLASEPDERSPLAGTELVKQKVRQWVCMGGAFPEGREFNLFIDTESSRRVLENWPTPVVFSGSDIGGDILTGEGLVQLPLNSPVRRAYELFHGQSGKNRQSWDQTAVLYAVRGLDGGLDSMWSCVKGGCNRMNEDGSNRWDSSCDKKHAYLKKKMPPEQVAERIESLMMELPETEAP